MWGMRWIWWFIGLFETKNVYIIFCFYITSTILTFDVPSAMSNSTIECYKTFMFEEGCTKIKMQHPQ
jgi:hypothetical protein